MEGEGRGENGFAGKVMILTGAAGGFGSAAAKMFSQAGVQLILSDMETDRLEAVAATLPGKVHTVAGDIADPALSEKLVGAAVAEFGGLDIAINNAGIAHDYMPIAKTPVELMRKVVDVDLMGVFYALRAQLNHMDRHYHEQGRGGVIVNIASVAGVVAAPMLGAYSAAKHGVVGLTKSAAIEYAKRGIRINALCPSFARTPMALDMLMGKQGGEVDAEAQLTSSIPMGRLAEVSEIMVALKYLADPANSFLTGQTLQVDGGLTAR